MIEIESHFEDIECHIIKLLRSSNTSIEICVAWINHQIYSSVLEEIARKGVKVEIIFNNDLTNANHGINVSNHYITYPISTRLKTAFMHNKFCIIDDETIITGSFNWSKKAKDSFENIVVIRNDYKLVKSYLHEFYDLIAYNKAFSISSTSKCYCRSNIYNLAIMGSESGLYQESKIDIWSLCVKNQHFSHIGEEYEQYLQTHLGFVDAPTWDADHYDKHSMQNEFRQERNQITSLQQYFNGRKGIKVQAVGVITMSNPNEHIEWGEDPEYIINIIWRDMYYRKIIPVALYDDDSGAIEEIISKHI